MKVELHVNGSNQVILIPETRIERAILQEIADSAGKGRAVRISASVDFEADPDSQLKSVTVGVEA